LVFGLVTALMMSVLTHFLLPSSIGQLALREQEVSRNVTAKLLTEGHFLHPAKGVTFYIRQIDSNGTLNDVFLSDRRDPNQIVTYTGARAFLVRDGDKTHLIMVNGMAQRLNNRTKQLSTTNFSDFSYDISSLANKSSTIQRNIREISSWELLQNREEINLSEGFSLGALAEEFHLRFARALICVVVALIGFSALMIGSHSRFGVWRQALLAFLLLIIVEGLRGVVSEPVRISPDLWPLIYLPALIGLVIAVGFLQLAAHPLSPRRWSVSSLEIGSQEAGS
jgi:lipopolysaccharide export system permease protein